MGEQVYVDAETAAKEKVEAKDVKTGNKAL